MDKLKKILINILKIKAKDISDNLSPSDVPTWDSFNSILLADALEREFDVKFSIDEIMDVANVGDIKRHLKNHNIDIK